MPRETGHSVIKSEPSEGLSGPGCLTDPLPIRPVSRPWRPQDSRYSGPLAGWAHAPGRTATRVSPFRGQGDANRRTRPPVTRPIPIALLAPASAPRRPARRWASHRAGHRPGCTAPTTLTDCYQTPRACRPPPTASRPAPLPPCDIDTRAPGGRAVARTPRDVCPGLSPRIRGLPW